jgi:hypothetical protein
MPQQAWSAKRERQYQHGKRWVEASSLSGRWIDKHCR